MRRYQLDASTRIVGDGRGRRDDRARRIAAALVPPDCLPAGKLFDEIAAAQSVAPSRLTERLLDAGAIHPVRPAITTGDRRRFEAADVTVVVPTHETAPARLYDILRHCLDTAGVMFVDDGSGTPLTGVRGATLVRLRHNSGPAAARNAGARAAETPIVAFVDTDVDLHPGWLDGLLWHFDDPRVGFVAPRVASGPAVDGGDRRVARYEERHSPLDLGAEPARIVAGTRVSYVPAAALLVRKDALDEIGGFDVTLRCGEDVDAVWRLPSAGWRRALRAGSRRPPPTTADLARIWRRSAAPTASRQRPSAARHGNAVAPVRMSPWSLGVWGLAAAGRPFSAAGVAGATALALVPKLHGVPAGESLRLAGHRAPRRRQLAGDGGAAGVDAARRPRRACGRGGRGGSPPPRSCRRSSAADRLGCSTTLSYGVGVWKGVLGRRRLAPLLPAVTRGHVPTTSFPRRGAATAGAGTPA